MSEWFTIAKWTSQYTYKHISWNLSIIWNAPDYDPPIHHPSNVSCEILKLKIWILISLGLCTWTKHIHQTSTGLMLINASNTWFCRLQLYQSNPYAICILRTILLQCLLHEKTILLCKSMLEVLREHLAQWVCCSSDTLRGGRDKWNLWTAICTGVFLADKYWVGKKVISVFCVK